VGIRESDSASPPEKIHRSDIDELIAVYADPVIKKVLLQRLNIYFSPSRKGMNPPEAEDLYQTVLLKLIASFSANGAASTTQDISEFHKFVATITHNVCNDFLRMKYPERNRLKNKLRDLMRRHPDFTCWMIEDRILCGLKTCTGQAESPQVVRLIEDLNEKEGDREAHKLANYIKLPLSKLVAELFARCEGAIEIDHLVVIIAKLHGIRDRLSESIDSDNQSILQIPDSSVKYYEHLETKEFLLRLWRACCELSPGQRRAFILTSSDYMGESLLLRLLREQVVTISQVYQSLDLTKEFLTSIWDKLPMDAPTAAVELGTSAQMIAKWRHRAMRRLSEVFGLKK
jgi:RNA polymerase sigma factor (sigma-70 family)